MRAECRRFADRTRSPFPEQFDGVVPPFFYVWPVLTRIVLAQGRLEDGSSNQLTITGKSAHNAAS